MRIMQTRSYYIVYWGNMGIMKATMVHGILGLYRDTGKKMEATI